MYTKRVRKLVAALQGRLRIKDGYLLPVVIGLGMGISVVSVTALQVISQNSTTLSTQYYNQLALEAARAGTSAAINCIGTNVMDWDTSGRPKLQPQTDCHGANVTNKPTAVLNQNNIETTYTVKALEQPYGVSSRIITSTGKTTIKDSGGNALASFSKTIRTMGKLNTSGGTAVTDMDTNTYHTCAVAAGQAFCWGGWVAYGDAIGTGLGTGSEIPLAVDSTGVLNGKTVTAITTGTQFSCAVASGGAYCWGSNIYSQLGNSSYYSSSTPVAVSTAGVLNGKTVTAIDSGDNHTCAIANGAAYCWGGAGYNYGVNGNNSTGTATVPVAVSTSGVLNGKTVTDISAGKDHTCAVADGKAYCWGNNYYGQLGNDSTTLSTVPVAVSTSGVLNGKTVTAISAGNSFTCAVADGKAYCWGTNGNAFSGSGQLGNGTSTSSNVPVAVSTTGVLNNKSVTAISAGDAHACAVADGKAYCWGVGSSAGWGGGGGRLGNGASSNSNTPVAVNTAGVLSNATITLVAAGTGQSCAIADGGAACWGDDTYYELGNGTSSGSSNTPVVASIPGALSGKTVTDISTANYHSCTVASNKAYCWGNSPNGQVGNGTGGFASIFKPMVPSAVSTSGPLDGKSVSDVDTGDSHSCAVASGGAYCWGGNLYGQLGNGSTNDSYVPVAVSTSGVLNGKTVSSIGSGASHNCVVASSQAYCWGDNSYGNLGNGTGGSGQKSTTPVAVSTSGVLAGKTVSVVDGGNSHSCAVANGQAYCWGFNQYGQLGNGTTTSSNIPVAVSTSGVLAGKTVTDISAGTNYTCAVASGKAYCWGFNPWGQLGNGTTTSSNVPVAVSTTGVLAGKTVTDISAGYQQTCAVANGKVYCWGVNFSGLGDGLTASTSVPIAVKDSGVLSGKTATVVSVGQTQACAVADNKAYCWGNNFWGQLGFITGGFFSFGYTSTPADVGGSDFGSPFTITFDNLVSF